MRTWTAEQASSFLRAAAEDRLYACWLLALVCGLRRGELAGLRWSELDPAQGTLGIVEQRTTDADWNVVTTTPKGTSRRTIDLGPQALAALQAHRRQTAAERREWGRAWTDTGLIFVREDGIGYHPSRITDLFQRLARQAGVPVIRLHDARHSCATRSRPGCTPRWCSRCSDMPPGPRRWTSTRIASSACRRMRRPASRVWCLACPPRKHR
ncbi:MAG: hypothetical protein QOE19_2505 [Actinomycetota bacterium]|nr:hypothetical protein [Actinomycetota bacterium]